MAQINVGRVIKSNKFAQTFVVHRKTGSWVNGRWTGAESNITTRGVVTACGTKDIIQVPEGDRSSGVMCFHSTSELFVTNTTGTSDEIEWRSKRYKLVKVLQWTDFGYYKAFGVSMEGD